VLCKQFYAPLQPKLFLIQKPFTMGRGDKKTKKGKIFKGSFGKSRPARPAKAAKAEVKEA
jgi:30S ribosomal protein S31